MSIAMKITILSHAEIVKAVVDDGGPEITATYYRRTTDDGPRGWLFLRETIVRGPLHLALDTVHRVVNA